MKKIIAISAIVIGLAGCSSSSDDATVPPSIDGSVTHLLLNGAWLSNCVVEAPISFRVSALLNDGIGSTIVTVFSDTGCTITPEVEPPETFTYTLGANVTVDGSVAGITTATQVDFIGTTPGAIPAGEESFDILAIKDLNTLYVGDDTGVNDGTTAALRPTTLSSTITFTKQDVSVPGIDGSVTDLLLNGNWLSDCFVEAQDSFKVSATFNNGSGSVSFTNYFGDTTCTTVSNIEDETFTYTIGSDVTVDGSVEGITTATQIDFIDTTPGAIPAGEESFDIFAIKVDPNLAAPSTLYVGDDSGVNDGSTAALRPTQLQNIPFTQQ